MTGAKKNQISGKNGIVPPLVEASVKRFPYCFTNTLKKIAFFASLNQSGDFASSKSTFTLYNVHS